MVDIMDKTTGLLPQTRPTPYILLDLRQVADNFAAIRAAFGDRFKIFFSVKANNHPAVLSLVSALGGGFDVASIGEVRQALVAGASADDVAFSNPVKPPADIAAAYGLGVRLFALDSEDEVIKLAAFAPGSRVYARMTVDNSGSGWPLCGKFGVEQDEAVRLLVLAAQRGLKPEGLTFHVGSQCTRPATWETALKKCSAAWHEASQRGLGLSLLDIGGGLPSRYLDPVPSFSEIAAVVTQSVAVDFPNAAELIVEPGRSLVGNAGVFVTSVIGRAERRGRRLVYLDAGVFNGLMETYECFWYPVECPDAVPNAAAEKVTLAGPTCDSVDIIVENLILPALQVGDRVVFRTAGAYTNSNQAYNGVPFPQVIVSGRE